MKQPSPGQTRHQPDQSLRPLIGLGVIIALVGLAWLTLWFALWFGAILDHQRTPGTPSTAVGKLLRGTIHFTGTDRTVLIATVVILVLVSLGVAVAVARWRHRHVSRVDPAARHMGRGRDIQPLQHRTVQATARRLGVHSPGLLMGTSVSLRERLFAGWEDVVIVLFGPRQGKTTTIVISAIIDAPGSVIVTSNKRDVVDATRDVQSARGDIRVFDPQNIVGEPPTWWWNPLSYVTDETKAYALAATFADASRPDDARSDAYFDNAGRDLLGNLILAAAVSGRPLTQVYTWLTRQTDDEAADLLAAHGHLLPSQSVRGVVNLPTEQRGGVFGTAIGMVSFLLNRRAAQWITPPTTAGVHEFVPASFVRRPADTVYLLSKEGNGSAGPLVTALTIALTEAAEDYAKECAGGRMPVPLVVVLDEAANVCKWSQLPAQYSHYGSRGICVITILQGWSQGERVWGKAGMQQLWSAATVKVVGSGLGDVDFLSQLSQLIGDYHVEFESVSHGRGSGSSRSVQVQSRRILEVADLAAMPKGRAVVLAAGARATLARTVPWMTGPHAAAVRASIAAHDPKGSVTVAAAYASLEQVQQEERRRTR